MSARKKSGSLAKTPAVVGTIHSPESLERACQLRRGDVDYLELRVDAFADPAVLLDAAERLAAPLIVTVRHPSEGGVQKLTLVRRGELYAAFLRFATYIDIELRSAQSLAPTIALARRHGIEIIASAHYFQSTPGFAQLARLRTRAQRSGATVFKVAARASTVRDVMRLLGLLITPGPPHVSVMGMGAYGKVSRLLFAQAGSVLNYGYLSQPQVVGQWEATVLKSRIAEITAC